MRATCWVARLAPRARESGRPGFQRGTSSVGHSKEHLPIKHCKACGRPFAWRKKWAKDWDSVLYCSARCRQNKPTATADFVTKASPAQDRPRPPRQR
ncbi:MAG: DUF2256 domain-containing protein [Pirellula sp.]